MKTIHTTTHLFVREHDDWQFVERRTAKTAVAVIAQTDDGRVVLIEQFRVPVQARVIDFPAGLVGDEGTNDPAKTAKKELEEETGYTCESVERLAGGPTSPGITSELVSFYRAKGVRKIGEGGGVGGEEITVHLVGLDDVEAWLRERESNGALVDVKIWGGLYFLLKRGR